MGLNNDNTLSAGFYVFNLITRNRLQLEAAFRGSWLAGLVIDTFADDMTRGGITIQTAKAQQNIKKFQKEEKRLKIWGSLRDNVAWGRLYGGAVAILQIEGQDLASPLDIERIAKGQFKGLAVYDRWQINPELTEVIANGPDIGLPKYYQITTDLVSGTATAPQAGSEHSMIRVHHSRCIRNIGIQLPYFQAITEMMWGESILERLWDRLISFDSTTMSAANLIERANNRLVKIDGLRQIMAAGGKAQEGLQAQFEAMRVMQTNEGITLLDKNDEFDSVSYSFSGLSDVMLQFGQQMGGAAEIPLVRLFGQSPAGLSATGESDLRTYYDNINSKQNATMTEGVDLVTKVMWRSVFGEAAPDDLEWEFNPLWQMSALDKANIAKLNTETVIGAHDAGMVSTQTGMKELRQQSSETGLFSNITDEEINSAEEIDPPDPMLEIEGEPGDKPATPPKPVPSLDSKSAWRRIRKWVTKKS